VGHKKSNKSLESRKSAARMARQERLADALRANLNRRKAQDRARKEMVDDNPSMNISDKVY